VLLYTLAKSQACEDANKRIALYLVNAFLALNGAKFGAPDSEIADRIEEAAESDRGDRDAVLARTIDWCQHAITDADAEGFLWTWHG
jgi:prophage maintenance system killer protein